MNTQRIVWIHGDCLNPYNPALVAYPNTPAVFVWDDLLLSEWQISLKRIMFMYECLLELPVTIRRGNVVEEVAAFAAEYNAGVIATAESVSPRFEKLRQGMVTRGYDVEIHRVASLIDYEGHFDLKRFSRFWRLAQKYAFASQRAA